MTKNEKYWQARTAQRMWEHMQSAEETADQVAKVYAKASLYLSREMQDIFKKYVEKHHLTEKEALQLLNTLRDRTSIEELRQRLQSSSQKQEIADLLAELEAPAYQARIQRLQELQTQIDLVMQQVYKQEQAITTAIISSWQKRHIISQSSTFSNEPGSDFHFPISTKSKLTRY